MEFTLGKNPFTDASVTELVDNILKVSKEIASHESNKAGAFARELVLWNALIIGFQSISPGYMEREFHSTHTRPVEPPDPLPGEDKIEEESSPEEAKRKNKKKGLH